MPSCRYAVAVAASAVTLGAVLASAPPAPAAAVRAGAAAHLRIVGAPVRDRERPVMTAAGDVNGDGLGDVLVGAPGADPRGRAGAGGAFVVFGRRGRTTVDLDRLGAAGIRIDGRAPVVPVEDEGGVIGEAAGTSVAALGDVDGDGLADVAIGAPNASHDIDRLLSGSVHVVFGRRDAGAIDLGDPGAGAARIDGATPFDVFGQTLAGLPGRQPSVAVGAEDRIHLVPVPAGRGAIVDVAAPPPGTSAVEGYDRGDFNPFYAAPRIQRTLAPAGDMNADGLGDLLVGPGNTDVEQVEPDESAYESSAFVVFGGAPADLARLRRRGVRLDGVSGEIPTAVVGAGDVAGDRRPDVLVPGTITPGGFGRFEPSAGPAAVLGRSAGRVRLGTARRGLRRLGERPATALAGPGDVDGDGRDDVALARVGPYRRSRGTVRVLSGRSLRARRHRTLVTITGTRGSRIGRALARAGDVDGDRRGDLLVASRRELLVVTARRLGLRR